MKRNQNLLIMKNIFRILVFMLFSFAVVHLSVAEEYKFGGVKSTEGLKSTAAGCLAPSGFRYLQVNNIRARINTGGDMWWDLDGIGKYFVPANSSTTSMFSGSLWIGGLDINNQLKLAALRYRAGGTDYWTGPLTIDGTAAIDNETCATWDKFTVIKRADVDQFLEWWNSDNRSEEFPGYTIPQSILDYPAHGDISLGQSYYMAPFKDVDGDGDYNPENGDYPYYDIENDLCPLNFAEDPNYIPTPTMETELYYPQYFGGILVDQVLKGDETFWWVFNDKGNFHSETQGAAIGMEIRAQAFGFSTNDEVNNMTFYSYEIINRSTYVLTETYFSPWVDTDLGYAWDDFVGCDVERGLGYCYNGTPVDGGGEPEAYGEQPPAIGVDFFQGPYMDPDDCDNPSYRGNGILGPSFDGDCDIVSFHEAEITLSYGENDEFEDQFIVRSEAINGVNFGNGIKDDERFGMRRFVYHNNGGASYWTDPNIAPKYYNFLRGFWNDNTRMLYGGNGHSTSGALGPECDFMFPGDSDPCNWGTKGLPPNGGFNTNGVYWTEENVGNNPDDRRFMQSAGPFTLQPGAVNYITVGMPWARAISGGPWASVELLRVVDDKAQALFDNCFKVIDGPSAPDLTFQELDREVIIYISNSKNSNNFKEAYQELDPKIKAISDDYDPYYKFEGYQIFQLKDPSVTLAESRYDPNKVRLVAQYDIKNGVGKLVNFDFNQAIGANVPVVEVDGGDNGVVHSFRILDDAFASGDRRLVNHKQYYYSAMAYGYNNYKEYIQDDPEFSNGQKKPYLAGRKNIKLYTSIPHKIVNGTILNSGFGDGPNITRIEGQGNGGMNIDLTQETIDEILDKPIAGPDNQYGDPNYPIAYNPVYENGAGPVKVQVIDPLNIKRGNYTLKFDTAFYHYTYQPITGDNIIITGGQEGGADTAGVRITKTWKLIDHETGTIYYADTSSNVNNEQLFPELGLSVTFGPLYYGGPYSVGKFKDGDNFKSYNVIMAVNNGLLESSIEYGDSSVQWLGGVVDNDVPTDPRNWIRSGTNADDWNMPSNPWDPEAVYEKMIGATWAPYGMCAFDDPSSPAFDGISKQKFSSLRTIASVDIVFTSDKTKWTRSPVVEMSDDPTLAEGNAGRFSLRISPSIDKDGNPAEVGDTTASGSPSDPDYIFPYGMGWFPGYAINVETGERLNIVFGEDSWLVGQNGRDMLFNPTSEVREFPTMNTLFGGKHYVYIMNHRFIDYQGLNIDFPAYDGGRAIAELLDSITNINANLQKIFQEIIYGNTMYVGIPLSVPGETWMDNDVKIRIRIAKPYDRYYSGVLDSAHAAAPTENMHYPMYTFSTDAIAPSHNNATKSENDLDMIKCVPNPYYAYSEYETVPLDNRIKIINLPEKCTVTIYNVSGTLIRRFTKDDPVTSIDWDLKNQAGIPIAGGVYMIHVKDHGPIGGERIVKWFGSLRVEDFNQF